MPWRPLDVTNKEMQLARRLWKSRARFLVDESVDAEVIPFLRDEGWNVKGVSDYGLAGHSDEDVYAAARGDDRIVLTHDHDFLDDRRFPLHPGVGVAIMPGGDGDTRVLVQALLDFLRVIGEFRDAFRETKIVVNSDHTLAMRSRDHATGAFTTTRYRLRKNAMPEIWEES